MKTKFTDGIEYFNSVINKVQKESDEYKLLCLLKYRYIQDFK